MITFLGRILFATKGTNGSVVAPVRPKEGHPTPSARARPASVRDHDEVDDRAERARRALVGSTRWEAEGGNGDARRESALVRMLEPKDDRNRATSGRSASGCVQSFCRHRRSSRGMGPPSGSAKLPILPARPRGLRLYTKAPKRRGSAWKCLGLSDRRMPPPSLTPVDDLQGSQKSMGDHSRLGDSNLVGI